jgi:hypothetical protein
MNDRPSPWLIPAGLILGGLLGILLAWFMPQSRPINTTPASLRLDFKDEYRYLIASAYHASGDLARAQARLATLADSDPVQALGAQAQRMLANQAGMDQARILANLAEGLQAPPTRAAGPTQTLPAPPASATATAPNPAAPAAPTSSASPLPLESLSPETPAAPPITATPRPTQPPTSTPGAAYALTSQDNFCDAQQPGLLQVTLLNAAGLPAAGEELVITWFGGQEHFYTGFKNEISPGYADYTLTSGLEYALSLSSGNTRLTGLMAPTCPAETGTPFPGSIRLEFKQP